MSRAERRGTCGLQGVRRKANMLAVGSLEKRVNLSRAQNIPLAAGLVEAEASRGHVLAILATRSTVRHMQKLFRVLALGNERGRGQQKKAGRRTILFFSKGEAPLTAGVASAISAIFAEY